MDEIVLRIDLDTVNKLLYALNHTPYTGDEHIDGVLSTFIDVLNEEIGLLKNNGAKLYKTTCPECGHYDYILLNEFIKNSGMK